MMLGIKGIFLYGQTKDDIQTLRQVALQSIQNSSPAEYEKYIDYYSKINFPEALSFRIKAALIRGNYADAIICLNQLGKIKTKRDPIFIFTYHFMAYQVSHILGVEAEANKHKKELLLLFPQVQIALAFELAADALAFDFIAKKQKETYFLDILAIFQKRKDPFYASRIYYFLGIQELQNRNANAAYPYFLNSEKAAKQSGLANGFELYGITGMASVLISQKKYDAAFKILNAKKNTVSSVPDLFLKAFFFRNYAKSAAFIGAKTEIEWASEQYYSSIAQDDVLQMKARALLVDSLENDYSQDLKQQKSFWKSIYLLIAMLFFLGLGILLISSKYKTSKNKAKEKEADIDPKVFIIPDKTEKEILEKLNKFEGSLRYTKSNISLKTLSLQLDTNPRYLSEIINKHKDVNFNTYINNLRIDYILNKLNADEEYRKYKVSYLAEESGFSSHSLFTTTFKNKVGSSPIEYIKNIDKSR
ncbi:helix-turn-helix domain-containing protein [Epilithonimonas tenax]|uniref:helix-turn-helix domain-containing protein n=1 Tax=Epilithonimonas tenax TaxID=191577 RepID=UPI001377566D|nr:helix-turn-helix domain-containing protein [Epilithonimonas tenax]